jgi:hypothetical protein
MVEKLKIVMGQFEERFGTLNVFAILKMDELVDKWTLMVSSASIDAAIKEETKRREIFDSLFDQLTAVLSQEESASLGRIWFAITTNHVIQILIRDYKVSAGEEVKKITDAKINGNTVHEGVVLRAE